MVVAAVQQDHHLACLFSVVGKQLQNTRHRTQYLRSSSIEWDEHQIIPLDGEHIRVAWCEDRRPIVAVGCQAHPPVSREIGNPDFTRLDTAPPARLGRCCDARYSQEDIQERFGRRTEWQRRQQEEDQRCSPAPAQQQPILPGH